MILRRMFGNVDNDKKMTEKEQLILNIDKISEKLDEVFNAVDIYIDDNMHVSDGVNKNEFD